MKITELQKSDPIKFCTDKFSIHSYGEFYDDLLGSRVKDRLKILEVGVNTGGSIRLFHDYLKRADIIGMDIADLWVGDMELYADRVTLVECDAYQHWPLGSVWLNGFDIIIDDGSHLLSDQIYALQNFPEYLKPGGILIIEDVPEGCEAEIIKNAPDCGKAKVINLRHVKGRWDDCLIVFKKD